MSRVLQNIKLGLDESLAEHLRWLAPGFGDYRILRQSVDARQRHSPHFVYSVEVFDPEEKVERPRIEVAPVHFTDRPVVIIGAGPAGLFAALRLGERGIPSVLLEQGSETGKRVLAIGRFWRYGELNPRDNVGFGEGGAGLFSDGKLITRIKSPHIPYVMQRLVQCGAPAEIEYLANPHVGSDRIRRVIPKLRERLRGLGCDVRFDCKVEEIQAQGGRITGVKTASGEVIACERVILACGHSAEDMFDHLHAIGVKLEGKSFAVGLRIEHPQEWINQIQYREHAAHPKLGAANYRLAYHDKEHDSGIYSFCMCPGGYVLSCTTDGRGAVTNGMSNYNRNSRFANAAIVVTVDFAKSFGTDVFGGLRYRRELEAAALQMARAAGGTRELPAQGLMDFLEGRKGPVGDSSSPSGVVATRLDQLFGDEFKARFRAGLQDFDRNMKGFIHSGALLHGVESRTSCPLRIPRDELTLQSVSHAGLYPTGEGAGYAGGITSAACDGIRVAEAIVSEVASQAGRRHATTVTWDKVASGRSPATLAASKKAPETENQPEEDSMRASGMIAAITLVLSFNTAYADTGTGGVPTAQLAATYQILATAGQPNADIQVEFDQVSIVNGVPQFTTEALSTNETLTFGNGAATVSFNPNQANSIAYARMGTYAVTYNRATGETFQSSVTLPDMAQFTAPAANAVLKMTDGVDFTWSAVISDATLVAFASTCSSLVDAVVFDQANLAAHIPAGAAASCATGTSAQLYVINAKNGTGYGAYSAGTENMISVSFGSAPTFAAPRMTTALIAHYVKRALKGRRHVRIRL